MSEHLKAVTRQAEKEATEKADRAARDAAREAETLASDTEEIKRFIRQTFGVTPDTLKVKASRTTGYFGSRKYGYWWANRHFTFTLDDHKFRGFLKGTHCELGEPYHWTGVNVSYRRWDDITVDQMRSILADEYRFSLWQFLGFV